MTAQHDRDALIRQTPEQRAHVAAASRVEEIRGLVEQEQSRGPQQRSSQSDALTHAGRVAGHSIVRLRREADLLKDLADAVALARRLVAIEPSEQREVLAAGKIRIDGRRLHKASDPVRYGPSCRTHGAAEHAHSARVAGDEPEQDAHQRGLASAVRAEEPVQTAGAGHEIHATKGLSGPVALRYACGLERGLLQHATSRSSQPDNDLIMAYRRIDESSCKADRQRQQRCLVDRKPLADVERGEASEEIRERRAPTLPYPYGV